MTDTSTREARARQAEAIGRMLRGAGPRFQASMDALLAERPGPTGTAALLDTAAVVERALQSGAREAARLLYAGARSCLEFDAEYRVRMDRGPEVGQRWSDLRQRARALDRRLTSAGAEAIRRWPEGTPVDVGTGQRLARECLALAEDILPGWTWLGFEAACVELQAEDWDAATARLSDLAHQPLDPVLRYWQARNLCSSVLMAGQTDRLDHALRDFRDVSGGDAAAEYFTLELAAARADERLFDQARERFTELVVGDPSYWGPYLATRAEILSVGLGRDPQVLSEWTRTLMP